MYRLKLKTRFASLFTGENIQEQEVGMFDEINMATHGMNRNLQRNIPFFFDNLKVVHRRILFVMAEMGLFPTNTGGTFSKSAGVVGKTLEKFHPHSDSACYEALIYMRQPWRCLLPLVETKGNYGNAENPDEYAQMRYVECRLSEFARDCFFSEWDLRSDLVDKKVSYNGRDMEPLYLPAKYPLFLMSWGSGIGFGASTSSPGFLPQEAMQAVIDLIENENANIVLYPEDPLGCTILDKKVFKEFVDYDYESTDQILKFRMRSDYIIRNGIIIIYNIPFEVKAVTIIEKIKKLVKENKIDGISDIETALKPGKIHQLKGKSDTVEIHIELKRGFDPHILMKKLYKVTDLQITFSLNCNYVNMNKNIKYNLRQSILSWIKVRRKVLKRMYRLDLNKSSKRIYVLQALIKLFEGNYIKEVIDIIRKNKRADTIELLIRKFGISDYQAQQISSMRLSDLSPDSYAEYMDEKKDLIKKIEDLQNILKNKKNIDTIIKSQMREGIKKYYRERQSKVIDIQEKDIEEYRHLICVTNTGFVKKLPVGETNIGKITEESKLIYMEDNISSKNTIFAFTNIGRVYSELIEKITTTSKQGIGMNLYSKTRNNTDGSSLIASIVGNENSKANLLFVTRNGIVKQTKMESYFISSQNSIAIRLLQNDSLVTVLKVDNPKDKLLIYTKKGNCILFNINEISITSRTTVGIQGIRIDKDDEVIGAHTVKQSDEYIITISNRGEVKKFSIESAFLNMKRGNNGISLISSRNEVLAYAISTDRKDRSINFINNEGNVYEQINTKDIPTKTRISEGDKLLTFGRVYGLLKIN